MLVRLLYSVTLMRNWGDGFVNDHVIPFSLEHELQESHKQNLIVLICFALLFVLLDRPPAKMISWLLLFTSCIDPASSTPIALPDSQITSL